MIKTYLTDGGRVGNGYVTEKLDCVVRAYSIAAGVPYNNAHEMFKLLGRKDGHKTSRKILKEARLMETVENTTLAQFTKNHPKGRYFAFNRCHAFAIIDGILFDDVKLHPRTSIHAWTRLD